VTIGAWWVLALSLPVLWTGEFLVRRIAWFARFNIPVPVVGGLAVALLILLGKISGWGSITLELGIHERWWNWVIVPEPLLFGGEPPTENVYQPFMFGFFTCVGLNASWNHAKRGSWPLLVFLLLVTILAVVQMIAGLGLTKVLGVSPLLGLSCGAISMSGGHATSSAFSPLLAEAGLDGAVTIGLAAATFGLVAGGLVGGPVGSMLIRSKNLQTSDSAVLSQHASRSRPTTFLNQIIFLGRGGWVTLGHVGALLLCMKLGSWVSHGIEMIEVGGQPLTFPGYIGAMIVGIVLRNTLDVLAPQRFKSELFTSLMFVLLGIFLAVAMMSLDLIQLAGVALPMLVILGFQVVLMALFAYFVTFRFMGGDFDAAVIAGGHCGFALGATPNAVANMESLVKSFGPSQKSFLVVPLVGGFLFDFTNALVITISINIVA
jgi:ESS family glutamate:Na+ symporter